MRPCPPADRRIVFTMIAGVAASSEPGVFHVLPQRSEPAAEAGHPIDDVHHQMKSVEVVEHHHVERCRRGALFLVTAYVNVVMIGARVGQPMDEPWITVVGENHWPVG